MAKEISVVEFANSRRHVVPVFDEETGEFVNTSVPLHLQFPDPIPVEIPLALRNPESTDDRIARLMREERMWHEYANRAEETIADREDFDVEEFTDRFVSEYEVEGVDIDRFKWNLAQLIAADNPPRPQPDDGSQDDEPEEKPVVKGKKQVDNSPEPSE